MEGFGELLVAEAERVTYPNSQGQMLLCVGPFDSLPWLFNCILYNTLLTVNKVFPGDL